eukprot:Blabericola_migrator_1__9613@NODE_5245_length_832_cov_2_886275_g3350_i0_p1_GENE_NODE_5245_length_832_cov_2_886275_g3350_i0NODE_5245_length_832_cov_2_886275_g3350_i0_p1_ORF_typecomplete_len118_score2_33MMS1_N/PF10433_9/0_031_NODE_5245_length_832_cov_2_886275_g3350_i0219572
MTTSLTFRDVEVSVKALALCHCALRCSFVAVSSYCFPYFPHASLSASIARRNALGPEIAISPSSRILVALFHVAILSCVDPRQKKLIFRLRCVCAFAVGSCNEPLAVWHNVHTACMA